MKARPILFCGPMVRALLDGRKTQTRRVVKPQPAHGCFYAINESQNAALHMARGESGYAIYVPPKPNSKDHRLTCPYGQPGDLLWVRETLGNDGDGDWWYAADTKYTVGDYPDGWQRRQGHKPSIPSIHMPRWASRLTLELTGVRVERLRDISLKDVMAEGCEVRQFWLFGADLAERQRIGADVYGNLWESINGRASRAANPWVWVLEFKVHRCNVDDLLRARAA